VSDFAKSRRFGTAAADELLEETSLAYLMTA